MALRVRSNPCGHSVLAHRSFAHCSNLARVHPGDHLAADQITAMSVGDGEWIATRAIARTEIALESPCTRADLVPSLL
jgi:hypothetical protein